MFNSNRSIVGFRKLLLPIIFFYTFKKNRKIKMILNSGQIYHYSGKENNTLVSNDCRKKVLCTSTNIFRDNFQIFEENLITLNIDIRCFWSQTRLSSISLAKKQIKSAIIKNPIISWWRRNVEKEDNFQCIPTVIDLTKKKGNSNKSIFRWKDKITFISAVEVVTVIYYTSGNRKTDKSSN